MAFSVREYITKQNLDLLRQNHPILLERLEKMAPEPCGESVRFSKSIVNLRVKCEGKSIYIHPEHNPETDSQFFLNSISEDFVGVEVIFGMGLGYGVQEILRQRPSIRYLVIIENNPGIFLQALRHADLGDLLSNAKVIWGLCPESADDFMGPVSNAIAFEHTQILKHPGIEKCFGQSYQEIHDLVYEYINMFNIAGATRVRYGEKMVSNRLEHLKSMGHCFAFEKLEGVMEGLPAYIVAGGPSLDKSIQFLKKVQNKAVIICVDSALPAFIDNGISPDFVTSIDFKDVTYEKFSHIITKIPEQTGLIVSSASAPLVQKNFPGNRKFYIFSHSGIEQWVRILAGAERIFGNGPSVANINFITARAMGCSPIIFVGQDLCYGAERTHFKSAVLTQQDSVKKQLKTGKNLLWVDGVEGGKVSATRDLVNMKHFFENLIRENPGDYINCSKGGAHIKGTRYLPIESVVDEYRSESADVSQTITRVCIPENRIGAQGIVGILEKDLKIIEQVRRKGKTVERILKNIRKELPGIRRRWATKQTHISQGCKKKLADIDRLNGQIDDYGRLWKILEEMTSRGLQKSEQMAFEIRKVEGDLNRFPEWLEKNIDRLTYVNTVRMNSLKFLKNGVENVVGYIRKELKLLQANPDLEPERELAELYMKNGEHVLAEPFIEKLMASDPDSAWANFFMGCLKAREHDYDAMDFFFDTTLSVKPGYGKEIKAFRIRQGDIHLESANVFLEYDSMVAKSLFVKGLKACPFHEKIQSGLAELLALDMEKITGENDQENIEPHGNLLTSWLAFMEEFPASKDFLPANLRCMVYFYCGKNALKENDKDMAITFFGHCMECDSPDPWLVIQMADLLLCSFEYDSGLPFLQKAIELDSGNAAYWEKYGDFLFQNGKYDEGITAYEQALHYYPEKEDVKEKIGQYCLQEGNLSHNEKRFDQALRFYENGIDICPEKSPIKVHLYSNKGSALKNMGQYDQALSFYDQALSIDSDYVEAIYNKGELLELLGEYREALVYYSKAIKCRPGFGPACQNMGNLLIKLGETEKGEAILESGQK